MLLCCSCHMKNHTCRAASWALIPVGHGTLIPPVWQFSCWEHRHEWNWCKNTAMPTLYIVSLYVLVSMMINWSSINHDHHPWRYCTGAVTVGTMHWPFILKVSYSTFTKYSDHFTFSHFVMLQCYDKTLCHYGVLSVDWWGKSLNSFWMHCVFGSKLFYHQPVEGNRVHMASGLNLKPTQLVQTCTPPTHTHTAMCSTLGGNTLQQSTSSGTKYNVMNCNCKCLKL